MKQIASFNSFAQMLEVLPDEKSCRNYLELLRWNNEPRCPHCGFKEHYVLKTKGEFKGMYKCKNCKERYTVTVGTMFEGSHVPLRKWFIALWIFSSHKKGISSHQLGRDLGLTQKSAWFILHRIREAFTNSAPELLGNIIEADEMFYGGENKNRHSNKKVKEAQGRSVKDKTPVFGMIERGGKLSTHVVTDTKAITLRPLIQQMIKEGSLVITDEWVSYPSATKGYPHLVVKHKEGQYVDGIAHTNTIENFWSLLSRGIYGIYHQVSPKHLQRYCEEFEYRFNERKISDKERFDMTILQTDNMRLSYKKLVNKA